MEQPREKQIPKRESNCSVVALVPEFPKFFDEFCVIPISMDIAKTLELKRETDREKCYMNVNLCRSM